ncbi:MAG: type VII toxin-antitoxin system HepT family RNase toxin [Rhodanobacteraceae bacterium]
MVDDVLLNKTAVIERCLSRIREKYVGHESELETDYTRQDSIVLNLQRACEAAIDLAMHVSRKHRLGLPQDAREAMTLLENARLITPDIAARMRAPACVLRPALRGVRVDMWAQRQERRKPRPGRAIKPRLRARFGRAFRPSYRRRAPTG